MQNYELTEIIKIEGGKEIAVCSMEVTVVDDETDKEYTYYQTSVHPYVNGNVVYKKLLFITYCIDKDFMAQFHNDLIAKIKSGDTSDINGGYAI